MLDLCACASAVPARHASVRASLEWSLAYLDDMELKVLGGLARLGPAWTLGEALGACVNGATTYAAVMDTLDRLVGKSLVQVDHRAASVVYSLSVFVRQHVAEGVTAHAANTVAQLTPREQEVMTLIARGCSNKEIGGTLDIAAGTARVHVEHILAKLGLRSRTQVAVWALRRD